MKNQEELLKEIVLKNDLQYVLNRQEQTVFFKMTDEEVSNVRGSILKSIQNKDLSLDVLEDYLTELKDQEYLRYLTNEGKNVKIEVQMEKLAELEGKCTQMVINIAKGMSSQKNLLGPCIHDTYGIEVKS